eukprot:TRINITY_DN30042_c0_g3_i2.p1 TRINITY_DN30042_c0_g3~~TRINITY_DN30042_c0_g3_i2.p1  ORF type:complete len:599 (+),score=77.64 TRINITY_DN30042_c0_g3_i2:74-1870(+)
MPSVWLSLTAVAAPLLNVALLRQHVVRAAEAEEGGEAAAVLLCSLGDQQALLTPWGANSLRLQVVPRGSGFPSRLWALLPRASIVPVSAGDCAGAKLDNGNIRGSFDSSGRFSSSRISDGKTLFAESRARTIVPRAPDPTHARLSNTTLYKVQAWFSVAAGERLYGLGQHKHGSLNQVGKSLPFLQGNTEVFIPFVVSSGEYGYLVNYPGLGDVSWPPGETLWNMEAAEQLDVWITTSGPAASPTETKRSWTSQVMANYADATGHAPVLPAWATGLWQSKNRYQTQDELLAVVAEHRRRNLSLSVVVIDYFSWGPTYHLGDFKFDGGCWPDPKALVEQLEEWGVKLMVSTYSNFVSNKSSSWEAATSANVLLVDSDLKPVVTGFQSSGVMDLFGESARGFLAERLRDSYIKLGIKAFWQDCDEWCSDVGGGPGLAPQYYASVGAEAAVASAYPGFLAQTWHEAFERGNVTDGIQLGRSAWAGSQRFGAAVWSGDIGSDWQSLRMSIPAGQSIGLSGIPWWTTDVGGYGGSHGAMDVTNPEMQELMVRWVQFGAFCPIFRIHGYRPAGKTPVSIPRCDQRTCMHSVASLLRGPPFRSRS